MTLMANPDASSMRSTLATRPSSSRKIFVSEEKVNTTGSFGCASQTPETVMVETPITAIANAFASRNVRLTGITSACQLGNENVTGVAPDVVEKSAVDLRCMTR